ncbi:ATP-dependent RNA helicase HrpA [Hahella sp. SMD15-11]|uniref:RNA helicase n=1 Tax=Thermohahella caldifontis TaxID=3142973 RepID=A0AB39UZK3_9GAMM
MRSISFPDNLPITERLPDIRKALASSQVVVVAGETGSGKTTQLPKLCLEMGWGDKGLIGHTQPRRLAARSVATRIAEELGEPLGQTVGFQVRFTDETSADTRLKVMTDGILLAETQRDSLLKKYSVIIIDEAHERSLNIDFLLGYLRRILHKRPELRVIITSATIDVERFSRHFGGAPVIEVSGRTYPVEIRYRPLVSDDPDTMDLTLQEGVVAALDEIRDHERRNRLPPGDVLVFLSGEGEIRELSHRLRKESWPDTEVLPLYARLSASDQQRIFRPHAGRRIVLSTNVAETSLTVPGIRYVIDSGLARISRYSYHSKVQRLPIEKISQASAQQRAGRCGRVAPGICFRLYAEDDFLNRPEFTEPEILRTNLAAVILQMLALRLGDISRFPFPEPPDKRYINDGMRLLQELGAVDTAQRLTPLGRRLARLPLDPRLGRILLEASRYGALSEALVIVAALAVQDPRERPADKQAQADQAHAQWKDDQSEFVSLLNLWNGWEEQRQALSGNQLRQWCKRNFIHYLRMREWRETHRQLRVLTRELELKENTVPADYASLHKALLSGFLTQVGCKDEKREYQGPRNRRFLVFPGAHVRNKSPNWLMASELVETSRLFARNIARIEPEWIEELGSHLLKRTWLEPHWSRKRGEALAWEQCTLFGLIVVPRRRVSYGRIDPKHARELLIREGLIENQINSRLPFIRHNQQCLDEAEDIEARVRRRDLVVDPETLFAFYDARIPENVVNVRGLEAWYRKLPEEEKARLNLSPEDVLRTETGVLALEQFPDHLEWRGQRFRLQYAFEPGSDVDGITLIVPVQAYRQLPVARLEWLVPGLLREKVEALIRTLPKQLRRNFVPVPDFAQAVVESLEMDDIPLTEAIARELRRMTGVTIPPDAWRPEALPPHLRMNIRLVDEQGRVLAQGRDYHELYSSRQQDIEQARVPATPGPAAATSRNGRKTETDFVWDDLPEVLERKVSGTLVRAWPYIKDCGDGVSLEEALDETTALEAGRFGLARLFMLRLGETVRYLDKKLPNQKELGLYFAPIGQLQALKNDLIQAAFLHHFVDGQPPVRTRRDFEARLAEKRGTLVAHANELAGQALTILKAWHGLRKALSRPIRLEVAESMADIKRQIDELVYPGFLVQTPSEWLQRLPVYLKAAEIRLEKIARDSSRERAFLAQYNAFRSQYLERRARHEREGRFDPELVRFRWMLEEWRVSVFAQQLKTLFPVSDKRLGKQWQKVSL